METKDFIKEVLEINFVNFNIFQEALTHRSYVNENKDSSIAHNERLEFLGDAVLELVTTKYLFLNYPDFNEGTLTSIRAALVKTESLAFEAAQIELGNHILMSKGEEATGGRDRPYILANTMEALIGATYLDLGFEACEAFILKRICYKTEEIVSKRLDLDSKSKIQEIIQEKVKITPVYKLIESTGPDHNKLFVMGLYIEETLLTKGEGKSKQEAEQDAALKALNSWEELYLKYFKK